MQSEVQTFIVALLAGFSLASLSLVAYWQLVVAEGAYLGRRVVAWLYDLYADRYDRVKQFNPDSDAKALAAPILLHLDSRRAHRLPGELPLVLDIATGTGRLPQTLLAQPGFRGHVVALDVSRRMLARAQAKLAAYANRVTWLVQDAQRLPFHANTFDVVTCLEALEFFPHPATALHDMLRVLKPDGLLMVSNRVGPDAWKMPGRTSPTPVFVRHLQAAGLIHVTAYPWLIDYDLVLARKAGCVCPSSPSGMTDTST